MKKRKDTNQKTKSKKRNKEDLTLEQLERIKKDVERAMIRKLSNAIKGALDIKIDVLELAMDLEDKARVENEIKIIGCALSRAVGLPLKVKVIWDEECFDGNVMGVEYENDRSFQN